MNPYSLLEDRFFWKAAVASLHPTKISGLWDPKFIIRKSHKISAYGSCFAQHMGAALERRGYHWLITESPPKNMSESSAKLFNYNVFSSRTGNIYTASLLKQWIEWSIDRTQIPGEVWVKEGRYYDPFRPTVEPEGFASEEELVLSRNHCLDSFLKSIQESDFFVFTLGLTESWVNIGGWEYPMCPGTAAGEFDSEQHVFVNQKYDQIKAGLESALRLLKRINPRIKVVLTVSPVPLTATFSGSHVLNATMRSKSVLRSVAAFFEEEKKFVDYFPSYEIINSPAYLGYFFESNKRTVSKLGVEHVMSCFFGDLYAKYPELAIGKHVNAPSESYMDVVCDEELLESFKRK